MIRKQLTQNTDRYRHGNLHRRSYKCPRFSLQVQMVGHIPQPFPPTSLLRHLAVLPTAELIFTIACNQMTFYDYPLKGFQSAFALTPFRLYIILIR
jgi:hypothetical protein